MPALALAIALTASAPLVTGNGHGFAVFDAKQGAITKLYAHPYSFTAPSPTDPLSEGLPAANLTSRIAWADESNAKAEYLDQSHVIVRDDAHGRQSYFMPWGVQRNVLVLTYEPKGGRRPRLVTTYAKTPTSRRELTVSGVKVEVTRFQDVAETLLSLPLAEDARAFMSIEREDDIDAAVIELLRWAGGRGAAALIARELTELERWRVPPKVTFASSDEKRLWRQSEVVLRMAQSREPNRGGRVNHGLILAALPDSSFVSYWVRDMAYAIDALIRMGHQAEARAAIEAYFHARPAGVMHEQTGGMPYQVSVVRYFGDGSEQPFFTQEGATNIELDNWGLVLWVLGSYVERFGDAAILDTPTYRGTIYESAKRFVVAPLLENLDAHASGLIVKADTSIWEERQKDAKHFAFSTIAALVGLTHFDALAEQRNDSKLHAELRRVLPLLKVGFRAAYAKDGRLRGTAEPGIKNDVDGAVLTAFNLGVEEDADIMQRTADAMKRLAVASGGYRRVTCVLTDPAIFEYWYERQEFVFVDLSLAEVYLRLGRPKDAAALIAPIVAKAARDHYFVPEMYVSVVNPLFEGPIGEPTGSVPMVGYGAGAFIGYLIAREHLTRQPVQP